MSQLIAAYRENCREDFLNIRGGEDRVEFLREKLRIVDCVPIDVFREDRKFDGDAIALRERANSELATCQKTPKPEILEFYMKSLSRAESDEILAMTYGNRSTALLNLNLFEECIQDIDRALAHNYPEQQKLKLLRRRRTAERKKEEDPITIEEPPVISNSRKHAKIQSASNCIDIRVNEKWGRHIVANRDIKIGEILAVETPFLSAVEKELFYHCHMCNKICYNMIPCRNCTYAFYCDENCKEIAYKKYHKYECPLMLTFMTGAAKIPNTIILPLRLTFLAMTDLKTFRNLEELKTRSPDEIYASNRYKEIYNLMAHYDKSGFDQLWKSITTALMTAQLVEQHTEFFKDFPEENIKQNFETLLILHHQIVEINAINVHHGSVTMPGAVPELLYYGLFSFGALFNHSCYPNVAHYAHGSQLVVRTCLTVKRGEQLFACYGPYYNMFNKPKRQSDLIGIYNFVCECRPCKFNWVHQVLMLDISNSKFLKKVKYEIESCDRERSKKLYPALLKRLRKIENDAPSVEINYMLTMIQQCYYIWASKRVF